MKTTTKVLLTALCVGALGSLAAMGVFGAFSATTTNAGNTITAGTVSIADNDAGAAMYSITNAKPGESVSKCIKVTYTGSLDADVHIYTTSTIGALGQYVELTITPGTQTTPTFPSCTGFTPDSGGALYSGTLANFATAKNSYANGVVDYPGTGTKWAANESVVYQVTATLQSSAPEAAQGATTGAHTFTWEARNQ
ncbi:MAG TPA: TasA family protein [Solirubrobacterales bacterium]|nr:TasA family protein [Solirubrobacterales bacterium]